MVLAYRTSTAVAHLSRLSAAGWQMLCFLGLFKVFTKYINQDHIQKQIPCRFLEETHQNKVQTATYKMLTKTNLKD